MSAQQEKIVGIIGGMGPEATCDFMLRIIRNTVARDDADHIRCLVDSNPKVPSRIKAIFENSGENPGAVMAEMAAGLEKMGADFLVIPCNTAHYYYKDVVQAVSIPVLNMIELAVEKAVSALPDIKKVGVLCTPATRMTELYGDLLRARGIEPIYPDPNKEQLLLRIIMAVKGGDTSRDIRDRFIGVQVHVQEKGAEAGLIACTELSVIHENCSLRAFDSSEVLARATIRYAKGLEDTD